MRVWRKAITGSAPGRWLMQRWGPAVWRLPRVFRGRMVFGMRGVARLPGVRTWQWRAAERVRPAPVEAWALGHQLARRPYRLPPALVCQVLQAWVVGKHAAAVTMQGRLLMGAFRESAGLLGMEANEDLAGWMGQRGWECRGALPHLTDVSSLVSRLDVNYYHWLVDSCSRLEGLETYERETGIGVKLLIRGGGPDFLRASLELLGVKSERMVEWEAGHGPQPVERLVVVSRPGSQLACSPRSLRWLRARFLQGAHVNLTGEASGRLYIPRPRGGWRSVLNEDEVVMRLEAEGFEAVRPEGLTLAEQVRMFSQARVVVGLHGAGLTNLLFAPDAAVIELKGDYGGGEYYSMASGLGQPYALIPCQEVGSNGDVKVEVEPILHKVDQLMERSRLAAAGERA